MSHTSASWLPIRLRCKNVKVAPWRRARRLQPAKAFRYLPAWFVIVAIAVSANQSNAQQMPPTVAAPASENQLRDDEPLLLDEECTYGRSCTRSRSELEYLTVDIARRTVLAYYPHAAKSPIYTKQLKIRPAGDLIHCYAKLIWSCTGFVCKRYESEVHATLLYTPSVRRVVDLSYRDNYWSPNRIHANTPHILTRVNEEFERRDETRMPHPLVGPRLDVLPPRTYSWIWNPVGDDKGWHVSIADDRSRYPHLQKTVVSPKPARFGPIAYPGRPIVHTTHTPHGSAPAAVQPAVSEQRVRRLPPVSPIHLPRSANP